VESGEKNYKRSITYFMVAIGVAIGLTLLLKEPQFTDSQVYVIFLLFFAIGLWATEAIPPFAVSLLIIAYLVFALGNEHINSAPENIEKYAQTFSSSVIWLMLGGFFLASAVTKTKLDRLLLGFMLRFSGTNPRKMLVFLMLTTMMASTLMSNTATTAMVIAAITPLLASLDTKSGIAKAFLLGVPVAASIGGMGTIIGTPSNAIAVGALAHEGINIGFLEWMKFGIPITLVLTFIACGALLLVFVKGSTAISLDFLDQQETNLPGNALLHRRIVIVVFVVTILLWLTSSLHGLTVASICAVPLVVLTLSGVLTEKDIQSLPWDTLLLVAGGLALGLALEQTGLLEHYAQRLTQLEISTVLLLFLFAFLTMLVSNFMSATAASTVMIPLGMVILAGFKTEIALVVAFSASTAMCLPVSTPPNAIAFSTGHLNQKDFLIGGVLVGLLGPLLVVLWVLLVA
jgi:sodium-dependent dicarboxylate transporter 2/3/5